MVEYQDGLMVLAECLCIDVVVACFLGCSNSYPLYSRQPDSASWQAKPSRQYRSSAGAVNLVT
jgi:hypothetical protein